MWRDSRRPGLYPSCDSRCLQQYKTTAELLTLVGTDPYAHLARVTTTIVAMADSRLKPLPQVLARRMPGGTVLVHLESNRIFELNETGARVWELISEGLERDQVVQRLVQEFAVDATRASSELDALVADLEREGLLGTS